MSTAVKPPDRHILAIRLGAMGDIIHALPAVASLKRNHPGAHLTWVVESKWTPLLEGNPFIDRLLPLRRDSLAGLLSSLRALRQANYDFAVDFQGLMKSALVARAARPERIFGFDASQVRERAAALFYTRQVMARSAHVVDRNLELAAATGATAEGGAAVFPLPPGRPEGDLPSGDFVLASPLAGWGAKQWPLEHYRALAERLRRELDLPLVLNGPPGAAFAGTNPAIPHHSALPGLIHATRLAVAVIGVDSGPLHLAAALEKPGVAIFGPTDPARNGPYGHSLRILRGVAAGTTYKRNTAIDQSMQQVLPGEVFEALKAVLPAGCPRR